MSKEAAILQRHDAGELVAAIATAESCSQGYVYGVLREHRPKRKRKPRKCTSDKPAQIRGLAATMKPPRIAVVLGISEAYVYRVLSEAGT